MAILHHPSDALLLDYASGAMAEPYGLAVATHATLCPACRMRIAQTEALGGVLLDCLAPAPLPRASLTEAVERLGQEVCTPATVCSPISPQDPVLTQPLLSYSGREPGRLRWRRIGPGAYQAVIARSKKGTARLLRIPAGRPVPEHSHGGLELTLVLAGAFCDATGEYRRGDLQEADETLKHQPHAAPGEDCICLAVTDAPPRYSSLPARLLQPFLGL